MCYSIFQSIQRCQSVSMADEQIPSHCDVTMPLCLSPLLFSSARCKQQENSDPWPQHSSLREILSEEHQAERGHSLHRVCLHLGLPLRGRDGDGLCLCALLLSLYLIWFILLMWFAVAKPWSWILRNERSLICFLGCWCWGSKVTGFRVAFLYNLCATNAFTL